MTKKNADGIIEWIKRGVALTCLLTFSSSIFAQNVSGTASTTIASSELSEKETVREDIQLLADPQLAMSVPDYPVTAGDVYTLAFAVGTTPVTYTIPVDSTYRIRVANLGVLNCKGLTYNQLKTQVDSLVSKNYPMGGVQFVLSHPAVFLVSITGEVSQATERKAWALTRLSSFVTASLTQFSSVRNVTIISEEGEEKNFDLFKAQREGDFSQDPYLRPGDKIKINRYDRRVRLLGAVERAGTYEILPGENLQQLINFYGNGLVALADVSRITLRRITDEKDSGKTIYLTQRDIDADYALLTADTITIASFSDLQPAMFIEGAVSGANMAVPASAVPASAGTAEAAGTARLTVRFVEGDNYAMLVRRYGTIFIPASDLAAAYILRGEQQIPLDLTQILYDASFYSDEVVHNGDTLVVPFRQFFVTVAGAVANPGRFPYIPDRDWKYYVGLAGGIDTSRNSHEKMEILTVDGTALNQSDFITPEATIDVKENSLWYKWNKVAPTVTTLLTIISTTLAIIISANALSK